MKLYHYTNLDAACKIIKNEELRLSHFSCMNDMHELDGGLQLIRDVYAKYLENTPSDAGRELTRSIMSDFFGLLGVPYYIFSLTETRDDALMFLAYVGQAAGCCLELDVTDTMDIVPVMYAEDAIRTQARQVLKDAIAGCTTEKITQYDGRICKFNQDTIRLALSYKASAWRHEKERRFVHLTQEPASYRTDTKRIIAYAKYQLSAFNLRGIIIKCNHDDAKTNQRMFRELLLAQRKPEDPHIRVDISTCGLR